MGIRKTEEKLVRWNARVEMLSVADCIPQFLYKKKQTLMLKLINSTFAQGRYQGVRYINVSKEMGVGRRMVDEVHLNF